VEEGLGLARSIDGWESSCVCAGLQPEVEEALTSGLHSSAKPGGGGVPLRDGAVLGQGRKLVWAGSVPTASLLSFFVLSFFFFVFLVYFISFANLIQINSNYFLNSSKIHDNVLNQ
jgi:hypothetical protein